jgi:hypothetical protein
MGGMRRVYSIVGLAAAVMAAVPGEASAAGWPARSDAISAARKDLSSIAPGFRVFVNSARCTGSNARQSCVVQLQASNDNVRARVSLVRAGSHVSYVDHMAITAGMGGGTLHRTFSGSVT